MTIFRHLNGSGGYRIYTGVPGGYRNPPPRGYWASWAQLVEERRGGQGWAARPSPLVRIGQGEGAGAPLPSLSPLFPLPNPIPTRKGGNPTPGGSRTPPGVPSPGRPHPPLNLYIRRQGAPLETQVDPRDHILSRVRCPLPP